METKIIKIPMQRLDAGAKHGFPVMRRVRAALALVLIMAMERFEIYLIFSGACAYEPAEAYRRKAIRWDIL